MSDVGSVKYRVELDDSGIDKEVSKTESKLASAFGSAAGTVGKVASTALKVGTAAVAAGTTAVAGLVKTATDAYGDFEQLTGGVETLFGDAASKVMSNAEQAFKSAGMSMNDYMETSIQSAAALINSLEGDQAKAADLMDMSIVDMSDNVNKMGTTMEAVQNAYRGFSRGNFTMLDNLALGFAGTKEGMQQLLDKAKEISGIEYDISSYSDIVQAIHVVQTEMGITGTTAKEASETLQGSLGQMQAAWQNLATGLADPEADLGKLIGDMVDSAETFLGNLIPIIQQTLPRIVDAIGELAPMLVETFIPMFVELAPQMVDAGIQLIGALIEGIDNSIPDIAFAAFDIIDMLFDKMLEATQSDGGGVVLDIIDWIIGVFEENYVGLVGVGVQILTNIINGITNAIPQLLYYVPEIVRQLTDAIVQNAPMLIEAAANLILTLALGLAEMLPDLIPAVVEIVLTIVEALIDNVDKLVDAAIALTIGLAEGLINALPILIEKAPIIVEKLMRAIVENLPKIVEAALQIIITLAETLIKNLPKIVEAAFKIMTSFIKGIIDYYAKLVDVGKNLVDRVKEGIKKLNPAEWGKDLVQSFINGIKGMIGRVGEAVGAIADKVRGILGFSEPKEGPLHMFHTFPEDMVDLYAKGIEDNAYKVEDAVSGLAGDIAMGFTSDINYNVPDLAGYASDLSASITGTGKTQIEVPVILDGREIARASAWYMGEQLAWEAR